MNISLTALWLGKYPPLFTSTSVNDNNNLLVIISEKSGKEERAIIFKSYFYLLFSWQNPFQVFPAKLEEDGHSFLSGAQDQPTQPLHPAELFPVRKFLVNKKRTSYNCQQIEKVSLRVESLINKVNLEGVLNPDLCDSGAVHSAS